jgi:Polysaccharide pyruvyl transferase.
MKTVAVITFHNSDNNYGGLLQCYALQKVLQLNGYNPYVINYRAVPVINKSNLKKIFNLRLLIGFLKNKISLSKGKDSKQTKYNYQRRFDDFRKEHISISKESYGNIDELRNNPPEADIYICGSDQIWNAPNNYISPVYFLNFGDPSVKRIAYAASFGKDRPNKSTLKTFSNYLSKFNAVFVREKDICELCHSVDRKDAEVVLDPTLLLDKKYYLDIMDKDCFHDEKYLFAYILNVKSEQDIYWNKLPGYLSDYGLNIKKTLSNGCEILESIPNQFLTIPQWLSAISHSSSYITTSFHGVALSIVLEKKFLVFLISGELQYGNERIITLLKQLGLENRIYRSDRDFQIQMEAEIDWEQVRQKLDRLRRKSLDLLIQAMESN